MTSLCITDSAQAYSELLTNFMDVVLPKWESCAVLSSLQVFYAIVKALACLAHKMRLITSVQRVQIWRLWGQKKFGQKWIFSYIKWRCGMVPHLVERHNHLDPRKCFCLDDIFVAMHRKSLSHEEKHWWHFSPFGETIPNIITDARYLIVETLLTSEIS